MFQEVKSSNPRWLHTHDLSRYYSSWRKEEEIVKKSTEFVYNASQTNRNFYPSIISGCAPATECYPQVHASLMFKPQRNKKPTLMRSDFNRFMHELAEKESCDSPCIAHGRNKNLFYLFGKDDGCRNHLDEAALATAEAHSNHFHQNGQIKTDITQANLQSNFSSQNSSHSKRILHHSTGNRMKSTGYSLGVKRYTGRVHNNYHKRQNNRKVGGTVDPTSLKVKKKLTSASRVCSPNPEEFCNVNVDPSYVSREDSILKKVTRKDFEKHAIRRMYHEKDVMKSDRIFRHPMHNEEQIFEEQEEKSRVIDFLRNAHREITNEETCFPVNSRMTKPHRFCWKDVENVLNLSYCEEYLNLDDISDLLDPDGMVDVLRNHGKVVSIARAFVLQRNTQEGRWQPNLQHVHDISSFELPYKRPVDQMTGTDIVEKGKHYEVLKTDNFMLQNAVRKLKGSRVLLNHSTADRNKFFRELNDDVLMSTMPNARIDDHEFKSQRNENSEDFKQLVSGEVSVSSSTLCGTAFESKLNFMKVKLEDDGNSVTEDKFSEISIIKPRGDEYRKYHRASTDRQLEEFDTCSPFPSPGEQERDDNSDDYPENVKEEGCVSNGAYPDHLVKGDERKEISVKAKKHHQKPREKPNHCLHLWEFLRDLLRNEAYSPNYIAWTHRDKGEFRLIKTEVIASLWGQSKNRRQMTYEKMARAMRYYYKLKILEKVPNKRLHFRFGKKILKKVLS